MTTGTFDIDRTGMQRFREDGFLVVHDVLDPPSDIDPVIDEYAERLEALVRLLMSRGELAQPFDGMSFTDRLTAVWIATGRDYAQWFEITLPPAGVRPDTPIHLGPAVFRLLSNPRLLDVVEAFLGPELYANPVQHIRMKLPRHATVGAVRSDLGAPTTITAAVPWHQDNGVYVEEADETDILTVWLPLNEATIENGCLQVIPASHTGLVPHCVVEGIAGIPEALLPEQPILPLPMRPGSVLIMDKRTIHGALDNRAPDQVRLSFDLRYGRIGEPSGRPNLDGGGFIVRSRAHPERVQHDPEDWARRWLALRDDLVESARDQTEGWVAPRWDSEAEWCA